MLVGVVGQTASGKSGLGIDLAYELGGPDRSAIVGMDAMQLYRGLDIGTAKTPVAQRRGIPHFQIDNLEVEDEASVAAYQREARADVAGLQSGGTQVVAVGGSGLYVRALLDRMEFPGTDAPIRAALDEELEREGPGALHARLSRLDPEAAKRIHPHNSRRIVRALEVIELTGRPFSATLPGLDHHFPHTVQLAIRWSEAELDDRIEQRTEQMFAGGAARGIVGETQALIDSGHSFGKTAARATGYAEALAVLNGDLTVGEAVDRVALATRQLSRRQLKWFRRDQRIVWLDGGSPEIMLAQALGVLERRGLG